MTTEKGLLHLIAGIIETNKDKPAIQIAKELMETLIHEGNLSVQPLKKECVHEPATKSYFCDYPGYTIYIAGSF